jgi:putative flippase GtrA
MFGSYRGRNKLISYVIMFCCHPNDAPHSLSLMLVGIVIVRIVNQSWVANESKEISFDDSCHVLLYSTGMVLGRATHQLLSSYHLHYQLVLIHHVVSYVIDVIANVMDLFLANSMRLCRSLLSTRIT